MLEKVEDVFYSYASICGHRSPIVLDFHNVIKEEEEEEDGINEMYGPIYEDGENEMGQSVRFSFPNSLGQHL